MAQGGKGGTGAYGVNPMTNAANGFSDAFNLLRQGAGANQLNPAGSSYSPVTAQAAQAPAAAGYTAPTAATANAGPAAIYGASTYTPTTGGTAAQYNAATGQHQGYNAHTMQDPASIASLMGGYQNPYEDQVVQSSAQQMQDALRQTQMANSDAAVAAGAFGGGRHGVVEGVANAQTAKDIGAMTAQLRAQGFNTAAGLAGQDISNTMQSGMANQQAINAARGFSADASNQMSMFNAGAQNTAMSQNAAAQNNMQQFNADALNMGGQFNAGQRQSANAANAGAQNNMSQFNTGQANQMNQYNAGLRENAGQFNAGQRNQMNQYNAGLQQDARQFNAGAHNQARQFNANQAVGNQQNYIDNLMGLSSMGGNLAQASYGVGNSINNQQMQQGALAQQLQQQILNQGQAGFDQQTQQAQQLLQMRLASLGMNPLNNANTTTSTEQTNPGWGAMFGNVLGAAGNMFSFNPMTLPFGKK